MPIDYLVDNPLFSSAKTLTPSQAQMYFQEQMSNTAHQREVDDLKKSGLNPVLSAGGSGASTPSGASSDKDPAVANPFASLLESVNTLASSSAKSLKEAHKALSKAIEHNASLAASFGEGIPRRTSDYDAAASEIINVIKDLGVNPQPYRTHSSSSGFINKDTPDKQYVVEKNDKATDMLGTLAKKFVYSIGSALGIDVNKTLKKNNVNVTQELRDILLMGTNRIPTYSVYHSSKSSGSHSGTSGKVGGSQTPAKILNKAIGKMVAMLK